MSTMSTTVQDDRLEREINENIVNEIARAFEVIGELRDEISKLKEYVVQLEEENADIEKQLNEAETAP